VKLIKDETYHSASIHMHGSELRILTSGNGSWDQNVNNLRFGNPMRRDTFMIPAGGHVILAFPTDSPGAWLMHCHIAWHASEGLVTNAIIMESEIFVPQSQLSVIQDQCTAWTDYYQNHRVYSQTGSGL
jgi:FtsP/CotA-like multicopper oxidase with cupredoxin domain